MFAVSNLNVGVLINWTKKNIYVHFQATAVLFCGYLRLQNLNLF